MKKSIFSIGIGPGDPELITIKAIRLLKGSDVVFVPQSNRQGKSIAKEIVLNYIDSEKLSLFYFPMNNNQDDLSNRYSELAKQIETLLNEGKKVSYVSIGDPTIFSTSIYLTEKLSALNIDVQLIPGINSVIAASTSIGVPLCVKGENFGVYEMQDSVEKTMNLIQNHSTTIFMKVNKKLPVLLEAVKTLNPDLAYLTRRMGLDDEEKFDLKDTQNLPDGAYLSVALIKMKSNPYRS